MNETTSICLVVMRVKFIRLWVEVVIVVKTSVTYKTSLERIVLGSTDSHPLVDAVEQVYLCSHGLDPSDDSTDSLLTLSHAFLELVIE